jgi:hypothetical protein
VTVCGVDDQNIDPGVEQRLGPNADVAIDSEGRADHQPTIGIKGRTVEGGAQRVLSRHDAQQLSVLHDEGHLEVPVGQLVEDFGWR